MNKRLIAFLSIFSLSLFLPLIPVNAAVKAGAACTKAGITSVDSSKTYTCIKSGKKLVWNKGVSKSINSGSSGRDWASIRSTDAGFINEYNGYMTYEKDLSGKLGEIQSAYTKHIGPSGIFRIAKYELGTSRPTATLSSVSSDLPISQCQISDPPNIGKTGFPNLLGAGSRDYLNSIKVPGPKMVVQVIPIFAPDSAKSVKSPGEDYDVYLDFIKSWAEYSSDGESNIQIRVPQNYLSFSKNLANYKITHINNADNPENIRFAKDMIAEVDSAIDFMGANAVLVVVPPGTQHKVFQQAVVKGFNTNEGKINSGMTTTPLTLTGLDQLDNDNKRHSNFIVPYWWLHEFYHAGYGLMDHHGPEGSTDKYGLGEWTLMSGNGGDLSAWEKWILGFITDSQVHCLNTTQPQTRWIAPSSVKTKEKKLIVIPLTQSKGIVIESIRPAGLYYKIPKLSNGVLVYEVNLDVRDPGLELKLVLPTNRNPDQRPTWLSQATLREGESVVSNGHKITIVESGTFGDVVKVEKVA
jgi:M6 family metalloprotease-like protein